MNKIADTNTKEIWEGAIPLKLQKRRGTRKWRFIVLVLLLLSIGAMLVLLNFRGGAGNGAPKETANESARISDINSKLKVYCYIASDGGVKCSAGEASDSSVICSKIEGYEENITCFNKNGEEIDLKCAYDMFGEMHCYHDNNSEVGGSDLIICTILSDGWTKCIGDGTDGLNTITCQLDEIGILASCKDSDGNPVDADGVKEPDITVQTIDGICTDGSDYAKKHCRRVEARSIKHEAIYEVVNHPAEYRDVKVDFWVASLSDGTKQKFYNEAEALLWQSGSDIRCTGNPACTREMGSEIRKELVHEAYSEAIKIADEWYENIPAHWEWLE